MRFNPLAYRPFKTGLVVLVGLVASGAALRVVEEPAWKKIQAEQPDLRLESLKDALGQGVTVGLLGGVIGIHGSLAISAGLFLVLGAVLLTRARP